MKTLKDVIGKKINEIGGYVIKSEFGRQLVSIVYHSRFFKITSNRIYELMDHKLLEEVRKHKLPEHIAIIMDGNRRFADGLGLDHNTGHLLGRDKLEEVVEWCFFEVGIKVLTVYAFSTENFRRDDEEVSAIMRLCAEELEKGVSDPRVRDNKICIRVIGHLNSLPKEVRNAAKLIMNHTKNYNNHFFNLALAYGGRQDILQAIHCIARDVTNSRLKPEDINEEIISSYLYTKGLPDPNLILRTSGEERLSNFLLWQAAHSDLYFSDVYWPELKKGNILKAIRTYQQRQRNFNN
jgi:tritrans,polycis-undecaprenyl-diphosphate synthase [geranylgeranyl-diphosphate specific]